MNKARNKVRIGVSLAFDYAAGCEKQAFFRLFGAVDTLLNLLREHGVSSIELRMVQTKAPLEKLMTAVQNITKAGLSLTIHGGLPAYPINTSMRECYPSLPLLLEQMREKQQTLVLPLHAYHYAQGDRQTLATQSAESLQLLAKECDREDWPVQFALELNRAKGGVDPSVDFASVVSMCAAAAHPRVGICWDWGHGYANFKQGLHEKDPPQDFVDRVIHTHIHDLNAAGKTHWPLTGELLPVSDFASRLVQAHYQGVWNLELSPQLFEAEPHAAERILKSIGILRDAIHAAPHALL